MNIYIYIQYIYYGIIYWKEREGEREDEKKDNGKHEKKQNEKECMHEGIDTT
jgi:hypothetical protein